MLFTSRIFLIQTLTIAVAPLIFKAPGEKSSYRQYIKNAQMDAILRMLTFLRADHEGENSHLLFME